MQPSRDRNAAGTAFFEAALDNSAYDNAEPVFLGEAGLVVRLRAGDPLAFEELVRTFGGRLLAIARRFVRDEQDAQDIVQSAYLSAFRALGQFEGTCKLSTWLHRIVVNAALMKLRSRRRKPEPAGEPVEFAA